MKLLGITGSLRANSGSLKALMVAMQKVASPDVDTEIVNLREWNLPFCHGGTDYTNQADLERFRRLVKEADAIILSTPEYHGSVSGVMKNALDLLDFEHVEGKAIALIAVCGGASNTGAVNALRLICRWLHAVVIPEQTVIPDSDTAFNVSGALCDPALDQRIGEMVRQLLRLGRLLQAGKSLPDVDS